MTYYRMTWIEEGNNCTYFSAQVIGCENYASEMNITYYVIETVYN